LMGDIDSHPWELDNPILTYSLAGSCRNRSMALAS
jgi:hypothetical protein